MYRSRNGNLFFTVESEMRNFEQQCKWENKHTIGALMAMGFQFAKMRSGSISDAKCKGFVFDPNIAKRDLERRLTRMYGMSLTVMDFILNNDVIELDPNVIQIGAFCQAIKLGGCVKPQILSRMIDKTSKEKLKDPRNDPHSRMEKVYPITYLGEIASGQLDPKKEEEYIDDYVEIFSKLKKARVNFNVANGAGNKTISFFAERGFPLMTEALIRAGAKHDNVLMLNNVEKHLKKMKIL